MTTDRWASWLLHRRDGGDPAVKRDHHPALIAFRDGVLDRAAIETGDVVLDVGTGTGLVAFGALERVGPSGRVIFSDVSPALLDECRARAGDDPRCSFVTASADDLTEVPPASVDVVTTRSVLIYVKDKVRAFGEFHRVLRPGGRIAIFEPINQFGAEERRRTWGYDVDPVLFEPLNALFDEIQPATDPMLDFDERDLVALAESAGFFPVRLTYESEIRPHEPRSWSSFLRSSWNPKVPTVAEAMDEALTHEERELLVSELRPAVEEGRGVWRMGHAYLSATKPR
jgi:ubiquinone/menaquinone biosynthesis C-methylase UbiE